MAFSTKRERKVGTPAVAAARDVYVLPNGNVLIAWAEEAKEFTRDKQAVFCYGRSPENGEIGTAVQLASGMTLISELGRKPRLPRLQARRRAIEPAVRVVGSANSRNWVATSTDRH